MPTPSVFIRRKGLLAIASLAIAILLIGALLPGYYVWTINYIKNPLTENEKIHLPKTTGATIDQYIKIYKPKYEYLKLYEKDPVLAAEEYPEYKGFEGSYKAFIDECEAYVEGLIEEKTPYLEEMGYVAPIQLPWGTEFILNEYPKKLHIDKPVDVVFQIPMPDAHDIQDDYWLLIIFIGIFEQGDVDGDGIPWELVGIDILIPSLFQVDDWKDLISVVNLFPGKYEVVMKIFTWTGAVVDFQVPIEGSFDILIYAVEKPLPIPIEVLPPWFTPPELPEYVIIPP